MIKKNLKRRFRSHGNGKFKRSNFASIGKNVIFEKKIHQVAQLRNQEFGKLIS